MRSVVYCNRQKNVAVFCAQYWLVECTIGSCMHKKQIQLIKSDYLNSVLTEFWCELSVLISFCASLSKWSNWLVGSFFCLTVSQLQSVQYRVICVVFAILRRLKLQAFGCCI